MCPSDVADGLDPRATGSPLDACMFFCRAFSTPKLLRKGPRRKPCGQRPFHRRISQVQDCKTIHNGPLADANHVSREYRAPASEPDCVWQAEHADSKPFHDGLMSKARRIVKEDESIQCKLKLLPHVSRSSSPCVARKGLTLSMYTKKGDKLGGRSCSLR